MPISNQIEKKTFRILRVKSLLRKRTKRMLPMFWFVFHNRQPVYITTDVWTLCTANLLYRTINLSSFLNSCLLETSLDFFNSMIVFGVKANQMT